MMMVIIIVVMVIVIVIVVVVVENIVKTSILQYNIPHWTVQFYSPSGHVLVKMMSIQSQTSIKTITHSYFDSPKQDIKMTTEKNTGKVSSLIDGLLDVNERYQNDVHYCTSVWYQIDNWHQRWFHLGWSL